MKRALLIGLTGLFAAAFVYCGWRYYNEAYLPKKQINDADSAQRQLFSQIRPSPEGFDRPAEKAAPDVSAGREGGDAGQAVYDPLAELKAANADAVGWLTIDGTNIDYPIVQTSDNSFYLQNGFDGKYNYGLGCPFLDHRCADDMSGFNSIVYAHHIMGNQAMFADIARYKSSAFMREHAEGRLLTADGVHDVRFFAYMTIPSTAFAYNTSLETDTDKNEYIDGIFDNANYTIERDTDKLKENKELRLLLLSTCTYEYWEARGVLVGVIE